LLKPIKVCTFVSPSLTYNFDAEHVFMLSLHTARDHVFASEGSG